MLDPLQKAERPDGRATSPETDRLREATRALRLHLDYLPAVFHFDDSAAEFFTELAFPSARQRYDCAESLLGASFGGTVLGALARSLFVDGLRWLWIATSPRKRVNALLGTMLEERSRLCHTLERYDASCPILPRWFAPLVGITDLTGDSPEWLHAIPLPDEDELLELFLADLGNATDVPEIEKLEPSDMLAAARGMLSLAGLRGAVMILAHAGHGNLLGAQSSLTLDGGVGHDLRPDHEALFMQVAAVGVTVTLLGVWAAAPRSWPEEIDHLAFLRRAISLTRNVVAAATEIHGLGAPKPTPAAAGKARRKKSGGSLFHAGAILSAGELLPDIRSDDVQVVVGAAEEYFEFATGWQMNLDKYYPVKLAHILTYGSAQSSLMAVWSTYQDASSVIAVFAARMLLEEAARSKWLRADPTEDGYTQRATRYFDEYRLRRKKAIGAFAGNGVARKNAEKLLELPENVKIVTPLDSVSKGRVPLPSIQTMLHEMGAGYPEPGWLNIAYSLLSQSTHSTPMGHLQMARVINGELKANRITPELLALTLDVACLGSAELLGVTAFQITRGTDEAREYSHELQRRAIKVHQRARMLHGLD